MSRIRSRQLESGSIPERAIRRGGVSRDKLQDRVVGASELLPGSASRAIQGSQVTAEAQLSRETINYFSGIIIPLASETFSAAPQTAGVPADIADVEFVQWQQTQAVPGLSGMGEDELRLPATLINTVVNGYCNVVVSGKFASYTGDAKVEIWRWSQRHGDTEDDDLKLVWPPAVWPEAVTDGGRLYGEGHAIVVSEGDALGIRVIHDSETPVGLDLAVEVYAVSRYRLERNPASGECELLDGGVAVSLPAPFGLTSWTSHYAAGIEHVGDGYWLVGAHIMSDEPGWADTDPEGVNDFIRDEYAVWLIRPDGTISDPWTTTDGAACIDDSGSFTRNSRNGAPRPGHPGYQSHVRMTKWGTGGALMLSHAFVNDRLSWDYDTCTESSSSDPHPFSAHQYRYVTHDGTDPVVGPALELFAGSTDTGLVDDSMVEGMECVAPSDTNRIGVFGLANQSSENRSWLLERDGFGVVSLVAAHNVDPTSGNPVGMVDVGGGRFVVAVATGDSGVDASQDGNLMVVLVDLVNGVDLDYLWIDTRTTAAYESSDFTKYMPANTMWREDNGRIGLVYISRVGFSDIEDVLLTFDVVADKITNVTSELFTDPSEGVFGSADRTTRSPAGCTRIVGSEGSRSLQQALFSAATFKEFGELAATTGITDTGSQNDSNTLRYLPSSHPPEAVYSVRNRYPASYFEMVPLFLEKFPGGV